MVSDRAVLIVVAGVAIALGVAAQRWLAPGLDGWQGPDIRFPDISGAPVSLADQGGTVLVVNFWASWCQPCREEMPVLDRLYTELRPRGLRMVGIALEDQAAVAAFLQAFPVSYPVLMGEHGGDALAARLGNRQGGLPFTVIFDARGRVLATRLGPYTGARLLADVESRLESSE